MAKLRVLSVDCEVENDAAIFDVIRAALVAAPTAAAPAVTVSRGDPPAIASPTAIAVGEVQFLEKREFKRSEVAEEVAPRPASAKSVAPRMGKVPSEPGDGSIRGSILEALGKKPLSSIELCDSLKFQMSQVSGACAVLKEKGRIASRLAEDDGTRRWFLK